MYEQTTSNPRWFDDGYRLLVSVWGKAYQQTYARGIYIIDTNHQEVIGPLVKIAGRGLLGNNENYFISNKYLDQDEPLSGNYIRYNFKTKKWIWLTEFSKDSLNRWIKQPIPNPHSPELIFQRYLNNAWQLFAMDSEGNNVKQLTQLGSSEISWSKDGRYAYFNRDVHKAPGARYVPYYYAPATEKIGALWPDLPDSVPQFPPLDTQTPIDFQSLIH